MVLYVCRYPAVCVAHMEGQQTHGTSDAGKELFLYHQLHDLTSHDDRTTCRC